MYTHTHTHTHICMHTHVHTHMYTHTHTHTCIYHCTYHCQNWLHGPHSGGEPGGGPVGSGETSLVSTSAWPPQCIGYSSMGLQDPWDEGGEVRPWVTASDYPSWTLGRKIPHLYAWKFLACEHNKCQTLVSALAPKRKTTQVFTLPSGVWFTSMARLATKQRCNFHPSECQTCWLQTCHPSSWTTHPASAPTHTHERWS